MQCLYCQKKLGMFASRKRPFCSQSHEESYYDEQSGTALRRLLEPLQEDHQALETLDTAAKPQTSAAEPPIAQRLIAEPVPEPVAEFEPPLQPGFALLPSGISPPPPQLAEAPSAIGITRAAMLLRKVDLPGMPAPLPASEEPVLRLQSATSIPV